MHMNVKTLSIFSWNSYDVTPFMKKVYNVLKVSSLITNQQAERFILISRSATALYFICKNNRFIVFNSMIKTTTKKRDTKMNTNSFLYNSLLVFFIPHFLFSIIIERILINWHQIRNYEARLDFFKLMKSQ